MKKPTKPFSSFSVDDLDKAKKFYGEILGFKVEEFSREGCGSMLNIFLDENTHVLVYPKKDHVPASFTILNIPVEKVEEAVRKLSSRGVAFEHYEGSDELGVMHDEGPVIAWFKDPAGNFISYMETEETVSVSGSDSYKESQKEFTDELAEQFTH